METKIKYEVVITLKGGDQQLASDPIEGIKERFDKGHHSPLEVVEQRILKKEPIVIRKENHVHVVPYDSIEFVSLSIISEEKPENKTQNVVHFTPK